MVLCIKKRTGSEPECGGCANSRKNSTDGVYCRLFGISVSAGHTGCRYHKRGELDEQVRSQKDDGVRTDV